MGRGGVGGREERRGGREEERREGGKKREGEDWKESEMELGNEKEYRYIRIGDVPRVKE